MATETTVTGPGPSSMAELTLSTNMTSTSDALPTSNSFSDPDSQHLAKPVTVGASGIVVFEDKEIPASRRPNASVTNRISRYPRSGTRSRARSNVFLGRHPAPRRSASVLFRPAPRTQPDNARQVTYRRLYIGGHFKRQNPNFKKIPVYTPLMVRSINRDIANGDSYDSISVNVSSVDLTHIAHTSPSKAQPLLNPATKGRQRLIEQLRRVFKR